MIIHFGVTDLPYSHSSNLGKSKNGKDRVSTTGEVAAILEDKYGVMQFFWERHQEEVVAKLEDAIQGAFESLMMGAPAASSTVGAAAGSEVEKMFGMFLDAKEMDGQVPGVATQASIDGVSHRFKSGRGPKNRPSFIDTALYQSSFRCWIDSK